MHIERYCNENIQKECCYRRKEINLRSLAQKIGAKSAIDNLATSKSRTSGKENVAKFQDLSKCASQQSNSWVDSDTVNLSLNLQKEINLRSLEPKIGAKSAIDKLATSKSHASGKENVVKFQDLSKCTSQQSNSWVDSDTVNLSLNK